MPYIGRNHTSGDHVNNFKVLDDISSYTVTFDGTATSVVDTTNDTIRVPEHRFIQGQRVIYTNGGGGNIGGLTNGSAYFIIADTSNTFKLATSASNASISTAINLSSVGTGTSHTINASFDGVNTRFKITHGNGVRGDINSATQLNIAINNVIQRPNINSASFTEGFSVEDQHKLVFKTAPTSVDIFWGSIIANNLSTFDVSDHKIDTFTGDGSTTEFNLSHTPANNESLMVTINGVLQHPSNATTSRAYSLIGSVLKFTAAPANGDEIQVRHLGFAGATTSDVTGFYGRTGNVVLGSSDNITVGNIKVGSGVTIESNGQATFVGVVTFGSGSTTIDNNVVNVGTALTLGHTQGLQFHTQNLHSAGFEVNQINSSGIITASSLDISGNASIGGVLTYEDVTSIDAVGIITARNGIHLNQAVPEIKFNSTTHENDFRLINYQGTFLIQDEDAYANRFEIASNGDSTFQRNVFVSGNIDANSDLDVDGHTNLDNVSIAGVTTTTDNINIDADNKKLQIGDSQDLELFHNGTNSVINNTEGALLFQNNGSSSMYIASDGQVSLNNDITFIGASANALWDKSENYFSIPDKIVHSGDTDTAIRFPGTDIFAIETGGSERLRVNSDRVIIGQSLSSNQPTYNSSTTFVTTHTNNPGAWNAIAIIGGHTTGASFLKFGDKDNEAVAQIGHYNADNSLRFLTNGNNERLRISGIGSISIGSGADGQRKVDIVTGGDNGVLIRPSTSTEGSQGSSGSIQDLIQLRTPWGSSAHNTGNAGARFGIQMRAYNINGDFNTKDPAKSAAIYAVSEDEFSGYWKNVGLAFYTSAYNQSQAEKVRIDTNGKVGIGTNNVQSLLHLKGTGGNTSGLRLDNSHNNVSAYFQDNNTNSDFLITYGGTGGAELTIHADGNLGLNEANGDDVLIGTSSVIDNSKLTIVKAAAGLTTAIALGNGNASGEGSKIIATKSLVLGADYDNNNSTDKSYLGFETDGVERLRINSTGNVNVSGITTSNAGFMFGTNGDMYLYKGSSNTVNLRVTSDGPYVEFKDVGGDVELGSASGTLRLSAGGNEKLRIASNGNVGINSVNPNKKLSIVSGSNLGISLINDTDFATAGIYLEGGRNNGTGTVGHLQFYNRRNGGVTSNLKVTGSGNFHFDQSVGIGTDNPSGKFDVRGDVYFGNDIYLTDDSGGYEKVEVNVNDIRFESKHLHSEFGVWTRSTSISDRRNGIEGDGNDLLLYSNTTEKVRIDSGGRSLFKTNGSQTSPIADNNVPVQIAESTGDMCYFGANKGNGYGSLFGHHTAFGGTIIRNVGSDDIVFYTNSSQQKLRITSGGDVKITTAGKGIDFSANTALSGASNVSQILNHYEMGTYVPTWTDIASSPSHYRNGIDSGTTSNGLSYVRIGKQVTITGTAFWSGSSSINNTRPYMSLPFPARVYSVSGTVSHYSLGVTTEIHYLNYNSTTSINFYVMAANSLHTSFGDNSVGEMYLDITYMTY